MNNEWIIRSNEDMVGIYPPIIVGFVMSKISYKIEMFLRHIFSFFPTYFKHMSFNFTEAVIKCTRKYVSEKLSQGSCYQMYQKKENISQNSSHERRKFLC